MSKRGRRNRANAGMPEPVATLPDIPAPTAPGSGEAALPPRGHDEFYFLPDREPQPVNENELRLLVKNWRRGRATRTLWGAIQDAYVAVLSALVIGAMVVNLVLRAQHTISTCTSVSCLSGRTLVPWAAVAGAFALALGVSRLFGPVLASAAEGFWLMDAPVSRSRLLGRRLVGAVVMAGLVGALLGAAVAALTGSAPLAIGAWAAALGLGSAGMVAFAAAEQGAERMGVVRALQTLFSVVGVAAMVLVVSIAAGWLQLGFPDDLSLTIALVVAGVGLVVLVGAAIVAQARLNRIRRARLLSGGSLVSGMQGAMFALDLGLVRDILVDREAVERGHVKPTKGRGLGIQALVWRDVQKLLRFPKPLFGFVVSMVVPYALDALGMSTINPFISGLVLVGVLVPFLSSLRVLTRTGGLARALPFPTSTIRTAAMAVPGILAAIWGMVAMPAFYGIASTGADRSLPDAAMVALVTAVAGLMGAVRWVTAKPVDFGTPMMATGAGAMPPTLIFNLFRGFDMVALITGPVMLGWNPLYSIAIAGVAFVFLRGTFSMDELRAQAEAQQKEAEKAKAAMASKEKIKIDRPK